MEPKRNMEIERSMSCFYFIAFVVALGGRSLRLRYGGDLRNDLDGGQSVSSDGLDGGHLCGLRAVRLDCRRAGFGTARRGRTQTGAAPLVDSLCGFGRGVYGQQFVCGSCSVSGDRGCRHRHLGRGGAGLHQRDCTGPAPRTPGIALSVGHHRRIPGGVCGQLFPIGVFADGRRDP